MLFFNKEFKNHNAKTQRSPLRSGRGRRPKKAILAHLKVFTQTGRLSAAIAIVMKGHLRCKFFAALLVLSGLVVLDLTFFGAVLGKALFAILELFRLRF